MRSPLILVLTLIATVISTSTTLARGKSAVTCSLLSGKNEIYRGSLESADTVRGARLLVTAQNKVIAPFNTAETRSDLELAGLKDASVFVVRGDGNFLQMANGIFRADSGTSPICKCARLSPAPPAGIWLFRILAED